MKNYRIILASRVGTRYKNCIPKQFIKIADIVNLVQTISEELIADCTRINKINPPKTAISMQFKAFGNEPKESLLKPLKVVKASLKTLISTGCVIDVGRI